MAARTSKQWGDAIDIPEFDRLMMLPVLQNRERRR